MNVNLFQVWEPKYRQLIDANRQFGDSSANEANDLPGDCPNFPKKKNITKWIATKRNQTEGELVRTHQKNKEQRKVAICKQYFISSSNISKEREGKPTKNITKRRKNETNL
jgi:hypothetical protein